ncbi:MAG: deaminase, partial [Candidatus Anstonellaceae archaeon]
MKDEKIMRMVFKLAKKGKPSPNPYVGAIIVKKNKIVGVGYHKKAGKNHAEVQAIENVKKRYKNWKKKLANSTLYVNLEPCNHYGKT